MTRTAGPVRLTRKQRRLGLVLALISGLGVAALLMGRAFEDSLVFFYSPKDITVRGIAPGKTFRLGGMVEKGSLVKEPDGRKVTFTVTDYTATMKIEYSGVLPDLFREGQGVVAQGQLANDGKLFIAREVLAKHDENYMPPEVAKAISPTNGEATK